MEHQQQFEYRERAQAHRPIHHDAVAIQARRMHQDGLKVHDIASILRIGTGAVRQVLGDE